jgi:hypothetical protein
LKEKTNNIKAISQFKPNTIEELPRPDEDPENFKEALKKLKECVTRYSAFNCHVNGAAFAQRILASVDALRLNLHSAHINMPTFSQLIESREIVETLFVEYLEGKVVGVEWKGEKLTICRLLQAK